MLYCFLLCTVTLSWSYHGLQKKILDAISQCFIIRERLFYRLFTTKFQNRTFPPLRRTHSPLRLPSAAPLVCANCLSLYCFPGLLSACWETNFLKSLLKSRIFFDSKKIFFYNQPILYSLVSVSVNKNQRHGAPATSWHRCPFGPWRPTL